MSDVKHARMMLELALKDFRAINNMISEKDFDTEIFGFHAQQAIEKTLKAWLSFISVQYPNTHDLDQLFALLAQNGMSIPSHFLNLADLNGFAVQYRYESCEMPDEKIDRRQIAAQVGEVIAHIKRML